MVAGIVSAVVHVVAGATLGGVLAGPVGFVTGAVAGLLPGAVFGGAVAAARVYPPGPRGLLLFLVDHTWSLPNTAVGALYLALHLAAGHALDGPGSRHACRVSVVEGVWPRYATTLGTVCAGSNPRVQLHEDTHILQARLLGPLYVPLVAANYALFTVLPVWWFWHDHAGAPIDRDRRNC
jgi:hypothetical protein